jgi:hypothetical protein
MKKNAPPADELMTPDEVANRLRLRSDYLSKYDEQLKPLWLNSRVRRYLRSRVEAYLRGCDPELVPAEGEASK